MSQYDYGNYTMKIREYTEDPNFQSNEEIWNTVNAGTTYYGSVRYDIYDPLPDNEDLRNAVQNALTSNRIVRIGILSNKESTNGSDAFIFEAKLHIDYSKKISVTVENSFGKGKLKVDDTQYSHGKTFTDWYEGDEHKFENWDQSYDGVNYVFQNKWTNVTTGQVYNGNPAFISFSADATLRAEFKQKIHITVMNRHNGGQLSVDGDTYDSGAEFDFWKNSKHNFESWEQNYGGFDMKFKDGVKWEMTEGKYYTALVENHEVSTPGDYIAQLYQQYNYTADNSFIDGGSGGTIKINGETKTIPAPDPYAGTTLEEDPFTVEAPPQSQTVNGRSINYNFIEWENGSTNNPRSINPDNHFDIAATYKGNMASTTSRATGYNNGRRMVRDNAGVWHLVYEDNGSIYYTYDNDGSDFTSLWEPEIRLAKGDDNVQYHNPSIELDSYRNLHLVYEGVHAAGGDQYYHVYYRKKLRDSGWEGEQQISGSGIISGYPAINSEATPVVWAETPWDIYALWHSNAGLVIRRYYDNGNEIEWGAYSVIPGTSDSDRYPSIARTATGTKKTKIVWLKNNSDILYKEGDPSGGGWNWNATENLTDIYGSVSTVGSPCISVDGSEVHIVCLRAS